MSAAVAGATRAREWVDHLRGGGTTPWLEWRTGATETSPAPSIPATSSPGPTGAPIPGAQQLELVRRINLAAGADGAPRALTDRVLAASAPGRGPLDLPLVGISAGEPFGAPPVDPAALPDRELLRLATGLIADDAAAPAADRERVGSASVVRAPSDATSIARPLPWRRRPHLVGDPILAGALSDQLIAQRYAPGRVDVLVLGGDLEHLLGAVWAARVVEGKAVPWHAFCHSWAERDRLPPRADLAALAATWERRGRQVRIVTDPATVSRLVRARRPLVVPAPVPAAAAEIALRVSQVLGVLVPAERRPALTRAVLDTAVAAARTAPTTGSDAALRLPPVVPAERRPWLLEHARRQRESLAAAEYPVHGRLEVLQPGEPPAPQEQADQWPDGAALTLAVRMLLGSGDTGTIQQGERRETRDQA